MAKRNSRILTVAMVACLLTAFSTLVQASKIIYGVAPFGVTGGFVGINTSGVFVSALDITVTTGETITGGNGLARHPTTGVLYCILKISGQVGRSLATMNPATGEATIIGNTGENIAGITFAPDGTLYAVTGDGGTVSESLHTIDPATAVITFVLTLGNGSDGEGIAFNTNDGLIYHASGRDTNPAWESIDPVALVVTPVGYNGGVTPDEVHGMGYDPELGLFWYTNLDQEWDTITPAGLATKLGDMDSSAFPDAQVYIRGLLVSASDLTATKTNTAGGPVFVG